MKANNYARFVRPSVFDYDVERWVESVLREGEELREKLKGKRILEPFSFGGLNDRQGSREGTGASS